MVWLVGWFFVGFGFFWGGGEGGKFNIPDLPEDSEMEAAPGARCYHCCVLQRCHSSVGWQRASAGTHPHSGAVTQLSWGSAQEAAHNPCA